MTESPAPAGGTVHWVGTGLSSGRSGLELLCDRAERLVVWGRTAERAQQLLARTGLTGRAETGALPDLALAPGDVLVSMLPATEHPALLKLCVESGAHFACSSYVSEAMHGANEEARRAGLVVLTEAGLDPGIDHLMARVLVQRALAVVGANAGPVDFSSYCGGVPAVPNDFRYRFSWAPLGVLSALASPAQHIEDDTHQRSEFPFDATRPLRLGDEDFEVYPNRDSLGFISQYGIPSGWRLRTFVRGTLRNAGWHEAWQPVFSTVRNGTSADLAVLADELAARYPTGPEDLDRVLLSVCLDVQDWHGHYLLDLTGTADESAMAKCVSLPLAYGVTRILDGLMPAGLNRAAPSAAESAEWLEFLRSQGLPIELKEL